MLYLSLLFFSLWFLSVSQKVLGHLSLWQVKEYRWDRFRDYFRTEEGKGLLLRRTEVIKIICSCLYFVMLPYMYFVDKVDFISDLDFMRGVFVIWLIFVVSLLPILLFIVYLIDSVNFLKLVWQRTFKRPKLTKKMIPILVLIGIIIGLFGIIFVFSASTFYPMFYNLVLLDILLPLIIVLVIVFFEPITNRVKKYYLKQAGRYLKQFDHLKIIGITGSYGKSSTKAFLSTVLAEKYRVFTPSGNINTEIGLAQIILKTDFSKYDIFVVEMGAYKIGEIKTICEMVHPQMGILTGINEQHLALFGTIENTMRAKYELIEALPTDGLAVFNYDNELVRQLAEKTKGKRVCLYSAKGAKVDYTASQIKVEPQRLFFEAQTSDSEKIKIEAPLIGLFNIENLLGVIAIARELGMTFMEIKKAILKIKPVARTMNLIAKKDDIYFIDDTYNANPDGVLAALDSLALFKNYTRIVVMSNLIELGGNAPAAHFKIGKKMGQVCDKIIITQKTFFSEISRGAQQNGVNLADILGEEDPIKILKWLKPRIKPRTVILFEGRGPEKILSKFEE